MKLQTATTGLCMHRHHAVHEERHQREAKKHNNGHEANGNLRPLLRVQNELKNNHYQWYMRVNGAR